MNYLDYVNCVDVCLGVESEVYSNADTCREYLQEESMEIRQIFFTCEKKKKS